MKKRKKEKVDETIYIDPNTGALSGRLEGHSLQKKCNEDWDKIKDAVRSENADLWWYSSDMPLSGTSGYAIVLSNRVLAFYPQCLH